MIKTPNIESPANLSETTAPPVGVRGIVSRFCYALSASFNALGIDGRFLIRERDGQVVLLMPRGYIILTPGGSANNPEFHTAGTTIGFFGDSAHGQCSNPLDGSHGGEGAGIGADFADGSQRLKDALNHSIAKRGYTLIGFENDFSEGYRAFFRGAVGPLGDGCLVVGGHNVSGLANAQVQPTEGGENKL